MEKAEKIDGSDELLTLTASQALEYGIARAVVKDRDGALAFLEQRDGVRLRRRAEGARTSWSEQMVSWLNSPGVMGVLVMLALLGVYIEFSTPGFGLPGLVAVICFAIIVGSKYLVGMANWVEIILLFVGIVLLLVEIFVLPGFGVAGILGIVCVLVGLFGMLIRNAPDELPWPDTTEGLAVAVLRRDLAGGRVRRVSRAGLAAVAIPAEDPVHERADPVADRGLRPERGADQHDEPAAERRAGRAGRRRRRSGLHAAAGRQSPLRRCHGGRGRHRRVP